MNVNVNFHFFLHIEDPLRILQLGPARKMVFKLKGVTDMPGTITVDTTNETVTLSFVDDKGNETPAPAGATVTFSSSDPNVFTVNSDAANPLVGNIVPTGTPGSADASVTVDGAMEPDGTTPIPNPDPVTVTVTPGAPAGERLTVGPA